MKKLICLWFYASVFSHISLQTFPVALRKLGPSTGPGPSLPWDTVRGALDHMAQAAANHIDKEHFLVLWEALEVIQVFNMTQHSVSTWCTHVQPIIVCLHFQLSVVEVLGIMETNGERAEEAAEQLERLLFILHTLVSYRDGAKITKPESICQVGGALLHLPLNWQ